MVTTFHSHRSTRAPFCTAGPSTAPVMPTRRDEPCCICSDQQPSKNLQPRQLQGLRRPSAAHGPTAPEPPSVWESRLSGPLRPPELVWALRQSRWPEGHGASSSAPPTRAPVCLLTSWPPLGGDVAQVGTARRKATSVQLLPDDHGKAVHLSCLPLRGRSPPFPSPLCTQLPAGAHLAD